MARKIVVYCDRHNQEHSQEVPANIIDVTIRVSSPENPEMNEIIRGTMEACPECSSPVEELNKLLGAYGNDLDEEAQQLLIQSVRKPISKGDESDFVLCYECKPPKKLKRGSMYSHSDKIHGKKVHDIEYRPYVEPENRI